MIKDLEYIIKTRRAIYPNMYTGKKISKNLIEKILKNSNYAPTHKLTQPWFFKVFSKYSKRKLSNEMLVYIKKGIKILQIQKLKKLYKNVKNQII